MFSLMTATKNEIKVEITQNILNKFFSIFFGQRDLEYYRVIEKERQYHLQSCI